MYQVPVLPWRSQNLPSECVPIDHVPVDEASVGMGSVSESTGLLS